MSEYENNQRDEIFSKAVRAGKRTYFFDVKATRAGENYLTITESKKRFNPEQGKFYYEKHKLFLYKEDFEKFSDGLETALNYIASNQSMEEPIKQEETPTNEVDNTDTEKENTDNSFSDISFEDLDNSK